MKTSFFSLREQEKNKDKTRMQVPMVGRITAVFILLVFRSIDISAQSITIGRLKYRGGGDWYSNPSSLPNLLRFLKEKTNLDVAPEEKVVSFEDNSLFSVPIVYMNGHGRVVFSPIEAKKLRLYLEGGGFLFADDNFGMDPYFRKAIKKVFPEKKLVEIPKSHPIFQKPFLFPNGLPKIHKHYGGPPKALGIFHKGRLVVFYSFNTDLGDGWEDPEVHHDPEEKRIQALKMGVNVIYYALQGSMELVH